MLFRPGAKSFSDNAEDRRKALFKSANPSGPYSEIREPMHSHNEVQLDFLEQCMIGDEYKVISMLNANIVNTTYRHPINGWTALHWAACRGHQNVCLLLLRSGFSKEVKDTRGRTPWEVCSEGNIKLKEILEPESLYSENEIMSDSDLCAETVHG
ncbi:ankyrin repeat protein [Dictyocaulus viviparus]|uniref:Ankyrin repeat protein n=1 Tax=Dictyocaulus viviparus TaxID=29172 RepID=A0A0D8Y5T3_DICVI|nr:ankyrin repeat protein [Dictyocaulus viviparus]